MLELICAHSAPDLGSARQKFLSDGLPGIECNAVELPHRTRIASRWRPVLARHSALAATIVVGLVVQSLYLGSHGLPMHWDPAIHTLHSMRVATALSDTPLHGLLSALVLDYVYYPPAYYVTTAPAFLAFGHHVGVAIAWQMVYLAGTLVLVSALTERFAPSPWGALAAFTYLCIPAVLGLGRMVYLENLQALQVVGFTYVLVRYDEHPRWRYAIFLGLIAGWGQLTKWPFGAFVGPLAFAVVTRQVVLLGSWTKRWAYMRPLVAALALACAIALPWYVMHWDKITADLHHNSYVRVHGNVASSQASAMVYYFQSLPWQLTGIPVAMALYLGLFGSLVKWRSNPSLAMLCAGVVVSVAILSVPTHKQGRFIVPLLPLMCASLAAFSAHRKRLARFVVPWVVAFGLVNCTSQTFDLSSRVPELTVPIGFQREGYFLRHGTPEWILPPIQHDPYPLNDIFERIAAEAKGAAVEPSVAWCLDGEHEYFNIYTLYLYSRLQTLKLETNRANANFWLCRFTHTPFYREGEVDLGRRPRELGRWALPDGSEARVYRAEAGAKTTLPLYVRHTGSDELFPGFYPAQPEARTSRTATPRVLLPIDELGQADRVGLGLWLASSRAQRVVVRLNGHRVWEGTLNTAPQRYTFSASRAELSAKSPAELDIALEQGAQIGLREVAAWALPTP